MFYANLMLQLLFTTGILNENVSQDCEIMTFREGTTKKP